ncbi:hypothetical protein BDV96DRAFT_591147 [Lophiotrema nucula]|uniref:C3H1-type domain-containing protein n=1 Tax=Lophiotrema nucula TaxID=690887 RepID=A0A6A5YJB0_9PLEO|nr:hypothetical protein BDV96DRAFT_591147 [Lophiotrema nucula]
MGVCTFYQRGNCKFGSNCKNEHPGQITQATGSNFGGGANTNRFGAFNGGGDRYRPGQNQSGLRGGDVNRQPLYHLSAETIKGDLTHERPTYPLSCYAPGRDAPRQLIEGPVEISPEELRLRYYAQRASGNEAAAQQEETVLGKQMQEQVDRILNDLDGAIKYVEEGANIPGNRLDIAQGKTPVGGAPGSTAPANPFGKPPANALGGTQTTTPAFGQSSTPAFGQAATPAFGAGASAFGKPAALGAGGGSAFGAPSAIGGGGGSAFGAPSALGGGGASAFGKPSMPTASAFGSTSALGAGGAFGKPSMPGATPAFGAGSAFGATANAGASAFGQQGQIQAPNPAFGKPAFGSTSTPANPFSGGNQSSPFTQPQQSQAPSAFGKPSGLGQTTVAFGQPQQPQAQAQASPFGQQQQTQNQQRPFGQQQQAQNQPPPFGQQQQSQQQAPAFGATAQPGAAFGQSGFGKAASWGQPQQQQQAQPAATASPFAAKPQSPAAAPSAFPKPAQSSPFAQQAQSASPFAQPQQQQPATASPFATQTAAPGSGKIFEAKDRQKEGRPEDYAGDRGRILEEIYTRVGRLGRFNDNEDIPLVPPKCEWIVELKL